MSVPASPNPGFQPRLEALRGLAALAVAGGHALLIFEMSRGELRVVNGIRMGFNGHAAVSLFFALSGYVLGLGLRRKGQPLWPGAVDFLVRRLLRIWPAMAVSVLLIAGALWLHDAPSSRAAAHHFWYANFFSHYDRPVTAEVVWQNLTFQSFSLNRVMWTLRIEIVCSACLPFLHFFSQRLPRMAQVALLAALSVLPLAHVSPADFLPLFIFYLGYELSGTGTWDWPAFFSRLRGKWWLVWLVMLAGGPLAGLMQAPRWLTGVLAWSEGVGAALIVGRVVHGADGPWLRVLDTRLAKLLGRLSYSFYLVHLAVLFFLLEPVWRWLPGPLPTGLPTLAGLLVWGFSTVLALPLASLLYSLVELPSIALGRKLDRRGKASGHAR